MIYQERIKALAIAENMERRGVTISKKRTYDILPRYERESNRLGKELQAISSDYGHNLELPKKGVNNSLREFLLDVLALPPVYNKKKSKTGNPTLDKDAMRYYQLTLHTGSGEHNFITRLTKKSKYDNALSYINQYRKFWHSTNDPDTNILHPNLNMTGTDTLRWSHNNPNSANIAKDPDEDGVSLRDIFGPGKDREWWKFDFKNVELRIPAYEADEREMIDLFERPNDPPYYGSNHLLNFHTVYPDIWDAELKAGVKLVDIGPHCKGKFKATWYQYVKNGGFAVQYGAMDKLDGTGTADKAFHRPGCQAKLKARFANLEGLNQQWISYAERNGYVETLPDREVSPHRGYPIQCTRVWGNRILPTVPLNYHVQSTAMWLTMRAMIKVEALLAEWRKEDFDAYITLQVHDELVIDFPKRANPKEHPAKSNLARARLIQAIMASTGDYLIPNIPTPVDAEYCPENWANGVAF